MEGGFYHDTVSWALEYIGGLFRQLSWGSVLLAAGLRRIIAIKREADFKTRSARFAPLNLDIALMLLDGVLNYGKAEAAAADFIRAGLVHPVKSIENMRDIFFRDAYARIVDDNVDSIVL